MAKPASNVINLPAAPPTDDWRAKRKERDQIEARSPIMRAAVAFCAARGAIRGGIEADHTGNGVMANWSRTAGTNYEEAADRALTKLTQLTLSSKKIDTVELWSLATVGERIQKDAAGCAGLDELERDFLAAFVQAVSAMCCEKYHEEWHNGRPA